MYPDRRTAASPILRDENQGSGIDVGRMAATSHMQPAKSSPPSFFFTENTMSILGNILSKIFPSSHAANAPAQPPGAPAAPAGSAAVAAPAGSIAESAKPAAAPSPAAMSEVDVGAMLDGLAGKSSEKLNWKTSIVDLMKLLGLDSSLAARKELAKELHYTGDTDDSASMNVWLHRQVMNKVAANGGKVPADLKD